MRPATLAPATRPMGALVDDVVASGRERLLGWIQQLNAVASQERVNAERLTQLNAAALELLPSLFGVGPYDSQIAAAQESRAQAIGVRDYLYEVAETYFGGLGALPALPIAGIVTAGALAGWIAQKIAEATARRDYITAQQGAIQRASVEPNPEVRRAILESAEQFGDAGAASGGSLIDRASSWIGKNTVVALTGVALFLYLTTRKRGGRR